MSPFLNAFTVDVEDYFQVSAFERQIDRADWDRYECRVVANTQRLLDLLARHEVHGTFFLLGWIADRYPQLVRQIHDAGHELGSHSYWHRLVYRLSPDEFRADLRQSRQAIEDAAGQSVSLYRAPSFSITKQSLWALEILVDEGFRIDSSIFPIHHDRYGIPDAPPHIHSISTPAGPLCEFPGSVAEFGRLRVPAAGGGYFRIYPQSLTLRLLTRINARHGRPFIFYVHPWELDPAQPRLPAGSRLSRLRHYLRLRSTEARLGCLLRRFRFGSVCDVMQVNVSRAETTTEDRMSADALATARTHPKKTC